MSELDADVVGQLKSTPSHPQASVTRAIKKIDGLMLDINNAGDVGLALTTLDQAVLKYEAAHDQYHASLERDGQRDDAVQQRDVVVGNAMDLRHAAEAWLADIPEDESKEKPTTENADGGATSTKKDGKEDDSEKVDSETDQAVSISLGFS